VNTVCTLPPAAARWLLLALLVGSNPTGVAAQTPIEGGAYAIEHYSIDGGSERMSGGAFVLDGSAGQPDADPLQPSAAGDFQLTGGFWAGVAQPSGSGDALFGDGFE